MINEMIEKIEKYTDVFKVNLEHLNRPALGRGMPTFDQATLVERISNDGLIVATSEAMYKDIVSDAGAYWQLKLKVSGLRPKEDWERGCPGERKCAAEDRATSPWSHTCKIIDDEKILVFGRTCEECFENALQYISDNHMLFHKGTVT